MRVPVTRWAHVVSDAEGPTKAAVQIQQDCRKPRTRLRLLAIAEVAKLVDYGFWGLSYGFWRRASLSMGV